jgi:magnesium transporter
VITIYFSNNTSKLTQLTKPKNGCLVYVENPTHGELLLLAEEHKLDIDLLKDGLDPNEAPRLDAWEGKTYIYTRFVLEETKQQTTSPVLIIFGLNMVYVVSRQPFTAVSTLVQKDNVITSKRAQLLLQILNEINTGYKARINAVAKRTWAVRSKLNKSQVDNEEIISFINIEEDLNDFLLALEPMNTQLNHLLTGKFVKLYEDDKDLIEDLELGSHELITLASSQLKTIRNIREAYSTIAANNLNKVFRFMTVITILVGFSTLMTGIYGMNVALPFDHTPHAFWIILAIITGIISTIAYFFKKQRWF